MWASNHSPKERSFRFHQVPLHSGITKRGFLGQRRGKEGRGPMKPFGDLALTGLRYNGIQWHWTQVKTLLRQLNFNRILQCNRSWIETVVFFPILVWFIQVLLHWRNPFKYYLPVTVRQIPVHHSISFLSALKTVMFDRLLLLYCRNKVFTCVKSH